MHQLHPPYQGHRENTNHCEKSECLASSLTLAAIDYVL